MPEADFLDRLGEDFRAAVVAQQRRDSARRRRLRRGGLVTLVGLVIAAPALAVVQPWEPVLGRPGVDEPASIADQPVIAAAQDHFAVLRRAQTATDRREVEPLLSAVGRQVIGVQTDSIRSIAPGWALVPVTAYQTGPTRTDGDGLCITNGQFIGCGPAATAIKNGITITSAGPDGTRLTSLVPDGVATVRFTPDGGQPVDIAVSSNFVTTTVPELQPEHLIKAPKGYDGPSMIPGPPLPVAGTVEWIDGDGRVVRPTEKRG